MIRKADEAETKPREEFKIKKFPPMTTAAYRRAERQGQLTLPDFGQTPPAVRKKRHV